MTTLKVLGVAHSVPECEISAGACDCHTHVFGPHDRFPLAPSRLYTPPSARPRDLLDLQKALHLERVVLVQPSVYGADNACLVAALEELGGRARGVAVIAKTISDAELKALHAAGVRGARVNLETSGHNDPEHAWESLHVVAERIAPLGWHLQTYTNPRVLGPLHDRILTLPVPLVADHFGRVPAAEGADQPALEPILSLMRRDKLYVKLSAPHRISLRPDYADVEPIARAMIRANPERVLWGSDWPHTSAPSGGFRDPATIESFRREDDGRALNLALRWADGESRRRLFVTNPAELYGF